MDGSEVRRKGPNPVCSAVYQSALTRLLPGTSKTVNEDCALNGSLQWEQREGRREGHTPRCSKVGYHHPPRC